MELNQETTIWSATPINRRSLFLNLVTNQLTGNSTIKP